jgi:type VI secretion system protein ImpL
MSSRWLALTLGLLTALFIGFAWWVYLTSGKLHWALPVACTVLPFVIAGCVLLARWLLARRGEKRLERAIAADGALEQAAAGSAQRAEVERLRREFEQAVAALKHSKLASGHGGAGEALYRLPWYAIIGPPACGKTTVLRNSGLKFPYLPGTGDRLKGLGGTRNCDWWLTNHAILLDTAGRWTLEEDDRDEWLTFLDLLKKHRRGSPLNGVIAAISLAGDDENALAGASLETVKLLAARMRERLDEIIGRLGLALPVYLLFTKCDLVSGFVETFGSLSSQERRQIWGFTAPLLSGPRRGPGPYFAEQFGLLRDTLERHALDRMGEEAGAQVIPTLYEFPAQFAALEEKLTVFVDELFEDSAYGETPLLRGAYFTSGTQESTPADLLYEELANALKVRPVLEESAEEEKKSYFLHDMLMRVVFEDRTLASASHRALLQQRKQRRLVTGALFGAALVVSVLPTLSCRHNLDAIEHTHALVATARRGGDPIATATVPDRQPALSAVGEDLARYEAGLPSLTAGFGLYQGDQLRKPLRRYYGHALREWIARPLVNRSNAQLLSTTQQLAALDPREAAVWLDDDAQRELQTSLKLHLLLTAPHDECVPRPRARQDFTTEHMLALWERGAPARNKQETKARHALLERYVELTDAAGDPLLLERDQRSVQLARAALDGDDGAGRVLGRVLERYQSEQRSLATLAGSSTALESSRSVPAAFTREAWLEIARTLGDAESFGGGDEDWVFGCGREHVGSVRSGAQREAFQRAYLKRYGEQWQGFVGAVTARAPSNVVEADTMLSELASRPGVLGVLFQRVKEHTSLPPLRSKQTELASVAQGAAGSALENSKVVQTGLSAAKSTQAALSHGEASMYQQLERSFADFASFGVPAKEGAESALEQYRRQLETVLLALKAYRADDTKLAALGLALQSAIDNVELLLRGHAGSYGAQLRQLLLPPLTGLSSLVLREKAVQIERLYCDLVYRPFQQELGNRYPLRSDSEQTASLVAFQRFFAPGTGALWNFQSTYLRDYVAPEGNTYRFGGADGALARSLFRDELIQALNHAARVTQSFFPGGSSAVRVPFRFRVRGAPGYSLTSFRVGNTTVRYDAGLESWTPAEWPGEQPSSGATLTVVPYQGAGPRPLLADGEWGLFRIFDARLGGRVLERSGRLVTAGWKPKADLHFIKVDFASDDPRSPLLTVPFGPSPQSLLPFGLPARIAHAGTGCP